MIESKGWNWEIVKEDKIEIWKNPSIESYYLLNRWKSQKKKDFEMIKVYQVIDYYEKKEGLRQSYHYHVLIHKK